MSSVLNALMCIFKERLLHILSLPSKFHVWTSNKKKGFLRHSTSWSDRLSACKIARFSMQGLAKYHTLHDAILPKAKSYFSHLRSWHTVVHVNFPRITRHGDLVAKALGCWLSGRGIELRPRQPHFSWRRKCLRPVHIGLGARWRTFGGRNFQSPTLRCLS